MNAARLIYYDDRVQLIAWNDLFVERWTKPGTNGHLVRLNEEHARYLRARGSDRSLYLCHVATSELQIPNATLRALVAEHVQLMEPHTPR